MAQMLVRNIEEDVAERFKQRARSEGKSTEQALRDLVADYARDRKAEALARLQELRARMEPAMPDPTPWIREDRDGDHGRR